MSVTGVLSTYERQVTAGADTRAVDGGPPAAGARRQPVDSLLASARRSADATATAVTWRAKGRHRIPLGRDERAA